MPATAAWWRFSFKKSSRFLWGTLMEMRKKQCVFLFTKDWRVIYGLWEVSRAWLGLMQSILIFITPTSCAYDILDLPWYAKSWLSLYCCLWLQFSLSLCLCPIVSRALSLYAPPPHLLSLKATLPWRPVWILSVRLLACLRGGGQGKSVKANVKRQWHYLTWQRSSSESTKMVLSTYSCTKGAMAHLSNA